MDLYIDVRVAEENGKRSKSFTIADFVNYCGAVYSFMPQIDSAPFYLDTHVHYSQPEPWVTNWTNARESLIRSIGVAKAVTIFVRQRAWSGDVAHALATLLPSLVDFSHILWLHAALYTKDMCEMPGRSTFLCERHADDVCSASLEKLEAELSSCGVPGLYKTTTLIDGRPSPVVTPCLGTSEIPLFLTPAPSQPPPTPAPAEPVTPEPTPVPAPIRKAKAKRRHRKARRRQKKVADDEFDAIVSEFKEDTPAPASAPLDSTMSYTLSKKHHLPVSLKFINGLKSTYRRLRLARKIKLSQDVHEACSEIMMMNEKAHITQPLNVSIISRDVPMIIPSLVTITRTKAFMFESKSIAKSLQTCALVLTRQGTVENQVRASILLVNLIINAHSDSPGAWTKASNILGMFALLGNGCTSPDQCINFMMHMPSDFPTKTRGRATSYVVASSTTEFLQYLCDMEESTCSDIFIPFTMCVPQVATSATMCGKEIYSDNVVAGPPASLRTVDFTSGSVICITVFITSMYYDYIYAWMAFHGVSGCAKFLLNSKGNTMVKENLPSRMSHIKMKEPIGIPLTYTTEGTMSYSVVPTHVPFITALIDLLEISAVTREEYMHESTLHAARVAVNVVGANRSQELNTLLMSACKVIGSDIMYISDHIRGPHVLHLQGNTKIPATSLIADDTTEIFNMYEGDYILVGVSDQHEGRRCSATYVTKNVDDLRKVNHDGRMIVFIGFKTPKISIHIP